MSNSHKMPSTFIFVIAGIIALIAVYTNRQIFSKSYTGNHKKTQLFTKAEIRNYNGIDRSELYLVILGKVYDVTEGADHYGPGKTYNVFIGKDRSRSFITGEFGEDEAGEEVADLSSEQLLSLNQWVQFYTGRYKRIGKLIGKYYDMDGNLTVYGQIVKRLIKEARHKKKQIEKDKINYPPCNIEWDAERGSHVWCTTKSGGIDRDWEGVPRQFYEPGSRNWRCACVQTANSLQANLKEYVGCDSHSSSCYIQE